MTLPPPEYCEVRRGVTVFKTQELREQRNAVVLYVFAL